MYSNKRAVSNIVLMIGIVLAMAVLLIGGAALVIKLIDGQARASPEFIATDLVAIINTVQAAPETATYNYYTEQDDNGFPRIGSLEIDDDTKELCVHPQTEDEIMNTITDRTAIAAGFGGVGYAYDKYRSAVAKKSAMKDVVNQQQFETFLKNLDKRTRYALGADTGDGQLLRKYTSGGQLSKQEGLALQGVFKKKPYLKSDLRIQRNLILKGENAEFQNILKATEKQPLLKRIAAKIPLTKAWKNSRLAARFMGYAQKTGESKIVVRISGALKSILKSPVKVGAIGTKYTIIGGIIVAQYVLSGGDWEQTGILAAQLTVYGFMPKLIDYLIMDKMVSWFEKTLGSRAVINGAAEVGKSTASKVPLVGIPACLAIHAGEVAVNMVFAAWDTVTFDTWMIKIFDGATAAVNDELKSKACKTFKSTNKPLLSPPNCNPKAKLKPPLDNDAYRGGIAAGYFASAAIFSAGIPLAIAGTTCLPGATDASNLYTKVVMAGGIATVSTTTAVMANALRENPTAIIPESSCDSCDIEYLRQDCPNWYISQPDTPIPLTNFGIPTTLLKEISGQTTFAPLMVGGVPCYALSAFGWASMACNGARFSLAIGTFFLAPDMVFSFVLQGDKIGFLKPEIKVKSADELPASLKPLASDFADNKGFWYAELPYVIEITKVYTNDTTIGDRTGNLIIRKA